MTSEPNQFPKLDYESPLDHAKRSRHVIEYALGAILACGAVLGGVVFFIMWAFNQAEGSDGALNGMGFPIGCALAVSGTLVGIAIYRWKKRGSKAFAAGLLMGLGIALLLEGICFKILK